MKMIRKNYTRKTTDEEWQLQSTETEEVDSPFMQRCIDAGWFFRELGGTEVMGWEGNDYVINSTAPLELEKCVRIFEKEKI